MCIVISSLPLAFLTTAGDAMGLITGIVLIVLGGLAASSSIVARRPDAQSYIDALVPYQGWIGFITCIWGVWIIFNAVLHLSWLGSIPIWWVTFAATGALEFALGLLLGFALLTKYLLSRNAEALRRGEQVRLSLVPYQTTLGYVAIVLGIWTVLAPLLLRVA
jgi:ABC-type Na+ efflux pump permease subunit